MKSRKQLDKEYEELEATGAEGKQGVADAKKIFKEKEDKEKEAKQITEEILGKQTKRREKYIHFLAETLERELAKVDWPSGWKYRVAPSDVGVVMEIETNTGRMFRTAFKVVGIPGYDLYAVGNYVERAEDLVDKLTPIKTASGIIRA